MGRLQTKDHVIRALFARSGNQCAFPGCTEQLINEKNKFICQVCHIEAAEPGGERYNPNQTDEDRRGYGNLIVLCYPHHVETNDVESYPVDRLRKMKYEHEARFVKDNFKIDEALLYQITREMNIYWSDIDKRHRFEHIMAELAIPVNAEDSFLGVAADLRGVLADINRIAEILRHSDRAVYKDLLNLLERLGLPPSCLDDHPDHHWCFRVRNWEVLNIGFENVLKKANLKLTQLELKYLEEYLKIHHTDLEAKDRMKILQKEFEKLATTAIYVD